jgi:hypothetical protein
MMLRTCEARLSVMSICVLVYLIFIPRETQHWMWRDRQIQHILTVEEIATEIFTLTTDEGFAQSFDFETRCYCWCSLASFFNSWEASRTLTFTLYLHHASFTCLSPLFLFPPSIHFIRSSFFHSRSLSFSL